MQLFTDALLCEGHRTKLLEGKPPSFVVVFFAFSRKKFLAISESNVHPRNTLQQPRKVAASPGPQCTYFPQRPGNRPQSQQAQTQETGSYDDRLSSAEGQRRFPNARGLMQV